MTEELARTEWQRADDALRDARLLLENDRFDGSASRAYYAAFHAASALLALDGRIFTKHSALEAAVHRDLVKTGRWPASLGQDFTFCLELRGVGDYGSEVRVSATQARDAVEAADRVLAAVREALPSDLKARPSNR